MSKKLPDCSLLDRGELPIAQLARIAMREGVRPRAAYQAHKWFARRLGITARSLLVAAGTARGLAFWRSFYEGDIWAGHSVLDPFVGGGVMLLEAQRLGADVYGVEIEPVAAAVANFQTQLRVLPDLKDALRRLCAEVGKTLAPYYQGEDETQTRDTVLHAFWVQVVKCQGCRHTFHAHPRFQFAWDENSRTQWVACCVCSRVMRARFDSKHVTCACGAKTPTCDGHVVKGVVRCPRCDTEEKLIDYSRRTKSLPTFRMFAVETLPDGDEERLPLSKRRIRTSTEFDRQQFERAKRRLRALLKSEPLLLPSGHIPHRKRSDNRLLSYGYRDYSELFNARQQLHLALLGRAIAKETAEVRDALAIAFSDHLTTNNMMCAYAGGWRRLTPLFSIRAYRHIARPVELNPWLRNNGRGTFPNAVRSITRAAAALKNPTEPTRQGLFRSITDSHAGSSDIRCGDARDLSQIASKSIDLVLTDPPYFDYIAYSELGHFFSPWLSRFGLVKAHLVRGFPKGQLASVTRSDAAEREFANRLGAAFGEMRRVCRDDGRVVFTFQSLDGRGWHAIAQAMAKAGVVAICTFPLFGDSSASLHKHEKSISWDCVMVCKVAQSITEFAISEQAKRGGRASAKRWSQYLRGKDLPFTKGDEANVTSASAIVEEFAIRLRTDKARTRHVG
jgi:putative DNA methylase